MAGLQTLHFITILTLHERTLLSKTGKNRIVWASSVGAWKDLIINMNRSNDYHDSGSSIDKYLYS